MRKRYIKAVKRRIYDYVVSNYERMDGFIMGAGIWNYKCHVNSVQAVKEGKAERVIACITVFNNDWKEIIVHFVNQLEDGHYQDNTWGFEFDQYRYYYVKEVDPIEFNEIENVLDGLQKTLIKNHSSWFLRKLYGIKLDSFI
jgi:hypothetical protein